MPAKPLQFEELSPEENRKVHKEAKEMSDKASMQARDYFIYIDSIGNSKTTIRRTKSKK